MASGGTPPPNHLFEISIVLVLAMFLVPKGDHKMVVRGKGGTSCERALYISVLKWLCHWIMVCGGLPIFLVPKKDQEITMKYKIGISC